MPLQHRLLVMGTERRRTGDQPQEAALPAQVQGLRGTGTSGPGRWVRLWLSVCTLSGVMALLTLLVLSGFGTGRVIEGSVFFTKPDKMQGSLIR